MSWMIKGNALSLHIAESGFQTIHGQSFDHEIIKTFGGETDDLQIKHRERQEELFKKWSKLEFAWSIAPTNAAPIDVDDGNFMNPPSMADRCISCPELSHISLVIHDDPAVGATIAIPPKKFDKVWKLFQSVLLDTNLYYFISIGSIRFKIDGAISESLTIDEFLEGKRSYSNEVSFSIGRYPKQSTETS